MAQLALFDLDGTLLDGDTDALWCAFLIDEGLLDRASFAPANREVAERYAQGTISPHDYCNFYAALLAGRSADDWSPLRERFVRSRVEPLLKGRGRRAVARHRDAGDRLLMSTATNRFLVEPIAALFDVAAADVIATELEIGSDGAFTGRTHGIPNMKDGKVVRMAVWLMAAELAEAALEDAVFYSDSINDLLLLQAVGHAVAVDADPRLAEVAARAGWACERFRD